MSEAAPGLPDSAAFATPERTRLAESVRSLVDAIMTTPQLTTEQLDAAANGVDGIVQALNGGRSRTRKAPTIPDAHEGYLPRSPFVGTASPLSPGTVEWELRPDAERDGWFRLHATGSLSAAYEGPPGFVHGGVVALAFDEVLGMVNIANRCPGMTGTLNVRYRRPTPLFEPLRWEAWVEHAEGRRVQSRATVWHGDTLCAEADGLFIQPRPEVAQQYFGRPFGEVPAH